jgi:hypothetical protein
MLEKGGKGNSTGNYIIVSSSGEFSTYAALVTMKLNLTQNQTLLSESASELY